MKVLFPIKKYGGQWALYQRYYHRTTVPDMHFMYIYNMLKEGGCNVSVSFDPEKSSNMKYLTSPPLDKRTAKNKFETIVNGKNVLFDITDVFAETTTANLASHFDAVFTTHWNEKYHGHINNIYPLSIINFSNWELYKKIKQNAIYSPTPQKLILNNQRPMGDKWRREKAKDIIEKNYKKQSDTIYY